MPELTGAPPSIAAQARTSHYLDPRELLPADARSERRPELRERDTRRG